MKKSPVQAAGDVNPGDRTVSGLLMRLLLATRPMFLTASVLPVLVGTAWGYRMAGELDPTALLLAIATLVFVHASANVLNDVFDDLGGTDAVNESRIFPYTGGSRFIQNALLSRRQMAIWGVLLLLLGTCFGAALVAQKGVVFLLFGLVGITLALLYSMPPVQLNARGLGELAVAAAFGVLPVTGAAWLQSGLSIFGALVLSLPVACWVMAILLANEVPDREADRATGKHTLVVRLGVARSRGLYFIVQALSLLFMALAVSLGMLQSWGLLLPALLLPVAAYAALGLSAGRERLKRSIELTLTIHMVGGLWLAVWVLVPV